MNTLLNAQQAPHATMVKQMTCNAYTMTNDATGDAVKVVVTERCREGTADLAAWPARWTREQAEHWDILAAATLNRGPQETPEAFTKSIHDEAATLGMDTLRELSRPLYREPDTSGEA